MKNIAVFCALPPERNTGMATVDLAAFSLIKRLAPDAEVTLYVFGNLKPTSYQPGELPYRYLNVEEHSERYFSSDMFIFWGDFIHSRSYWTIEQAYWEKHLRTVAELEQWYKEQFEKVAKYIFLTSLTPSRLKDVIVFGSTIITNDAANETDKNEADKAYYRLFTHFFVNVRAVYFRDALSAAKISPFRGNEATLGCDCAFLLQNFDLQQITGFTPATQRKGVGVFLGRSSSNTKLMLFARLVGKHLGERCFWLPWFIWYPPKFRHRLKSIVLGFQPVAQDVEIGVLLSSLSGYKYIITDTYHLSINAWRMGIPAICLGEGAGGLLTSINDKKKEILYEMYGARKFYVFVESFRSLRSLRSIRRFLAEAKRTADILQNRAVVSQVCDNIARHQDMAKQRLADAILLVLRDK